MPVYGHRTLVFATPSSLQDLDESMDTDVNHETSAFQEWAVEIKPKGVWFQKFWLIGCLGPLEVPEKVEKTVRLSITAIRTAHPCGKVNVGIIIYGQQDNIDYVSKVIRRQFHFTAEHTMLNFDDLVDFELLNGSATAAAARYPVNQAECDSTTIINAHKSPFLCGNSCDTLKILITVTPVLG